MKVVMTSIEALLRQKEMDRSSERERESVKEIKSKGQGTD